MKKIILMTVIVAIAGLCAGELEYKKCSVCHGTKGEKKALGKSKIIADLTVSELKTAIKGYRDGTYGGAMKSVMKVQVGKLSDKEITSMAEYIYSFKNKNVVKKTVIEASKEVEKETNTSVKKNKEPVIETVAKVDMSENYKRCMSCHGEKGEKKALGKSKIISNMTEKEIETAINGYRDGTYGGAMKNVMKVQANSIKKKDIKSMAKYISSLK